MFFWWVSNTSKATEMANTRYNGFSTLKTTKINMGKAMLAKMELKETKRVRYKTNRNTPTQETAVQGDIPKTIPNKVATPLPPLNSAQIGKI